jgi:hypothetical protein
VYRFVADVSKENVAYLCRVAVVVFEVLTTVTRHIIVSSDVIAVYYVGLFPTFWRKALYKS